MKKIKIILISFMVILFSGSAASAVTYDTTTDWNVLGYQGDNGYKAVQVTGMYEFADPAGSDNATVGVTNLLPDGPYDATGRAAFFVGNDSKDDKDPTPSANIGQAGDGILNGDAQDWLIKNTDPALYYRFDGEEFISGSEFQDVDGDGSSNDPGWIYLGKQDGAWQKDDDGFVVQQGANGNSTYVPQPFSYEKIRGIDIGSLIDINLTYTFDADDDTEIISAIWSLTPKDGILDTLKPLLGNNYFDHLAIVLKSSDYFAVYDLDFNEIFALEGLTQEYFAPVKLTGYLDNSDLTLNGNTQAISHISLWAHDPLAPPQVVPEPATLILLGSGLAGLATMGIRRKKNS